MTNLLINKQILTVILPSYNEKANVDILVQGLYEADVHSQIKRIIYVDDDSADNTSEHIKTSTYPVDVLCLQRIGRQGLSSAVVEGILLADTRYVAVMDADGQHLASDLMRMLQIAISEGDQLVIGSRFKDHATLETHVGLRSLLSRVGNHLANHVLRRQLSDPLTGFFLIERQLFNTISHRIRGSGFKILVDLIYNLRDQNIKIAETQIQFAKRMHGESKLDSGVMIEFVDQMIGLFIGRLYPEKFLGFLVVGVIGMCVHFALLSILLFQAATSFSTAQAVATLTAMVSNYALNNLLTFRRNRLSGISWLKGLIYFILVCSFGAIANVGIAGFIYKLDNIWWLSGFAGIVVGTVFNFTLSKYFVWKK
ncbi:GtrA family protein [Polynucleobacter sp. IMCC30063]|uniref:glycosyltransferase n=1 Tax=Polynucleobacter sp. IMCC30063 TaxID=2907298 RepID=UPI001F3009DA|nr:glycosyltransferase [Polynucleobacter sp. IMCC30063]MCE7505237.1 GtrA family protein [Polynucleobacter sp. IMCC30063]